MIRDDRQYRITQERVERFRAALAKIDIERPTQADPRLQQAGIDAMRAQLEVLERELRAYATRHRRPDGDDPVS